jgi:hypothetical protein
MQNGAGSPDELDPRMARVVPAQLYIPGFGVRALILLALQSSQLGSASSLPSGILLGHYLIRFDKSLAPVSWGVAPSRAWRSPSFGVHSALEVLPPAFGDRNFGRRDGSSVLSKDVEQNDEIPRPSVQHSKELPSVMAPKFTQFPSDLRTVRKWQIWIRRRQHVETVNLVVERDLPPDR